MSIVPPGNGLFTAFTSPVQIQVMSPLRSSSRPIVTITTRICELRSTGRITDLVDADAAEEGGERA